MAMRQGGLKALSNMEHPASLCVFCCGMEGPNGQCDFGNEKSDKGFCEQKGRLRCEFCCLRRRDHALLGENGAGKSTFKNMLVGLLEPTGGSITFDGREMKEIKMGKLPIAAVHQELSLFLNLTVARISASRIFRGSGRLSTGKSAVTKLSNIWI